MTDIEPARQAAYNAVYEVIRALPPRAATDYGRAEENGRVWRAVERALDTYRQSAVEPLERQRDAVLAVADKHARCCNPVTRQIRAIYQTTEGATS